MNVKTTQSWGAGKTKHKAAEILIEKHNRLEQALVNILSVCNRPGSCHLKLSMIETLCETMVEDGDG